MHGGDGGAEIEADEGSFARAKRAARLHGLLERLAAHELHPQSDAPIMLFGAVDLHHVRVTHARQAPRLLQEPRVRVDVIAIVVQQLERDFTVELRVPRAIDVARCPVADAIEDGEPAPVRPRRSRLTDAIGAGGLL